jgi:uncharacterized protein (DUF1330 family)
MCIGEEYFFWNTRVTTSSSVAQCERASASVVFVRSFARSFVPFGGLVCGTGESLARIENENETRVLVVLIFKAQARARKGGARTRCRS